MNSNSKYIYMIHIAYVWAGLVITIFFLENFILKSEYQNEYIIDVMLKNKSVSKRLETFWALLNYSHVNAE